VKPPVPELEEEVTKVARPKKATAKKAHKSKIQEMEDSNFDEEESEDDLSSEEAKPSKVKSAAKSKEKTTEPKYKLPKSKEKENTDPKVPLPAPKLGGFLSQSLAKPVSDAGSAPDQRKAFGGMLSGLGLFKKSQQGGAETVAVNDFESTDLAPKIPKQYADKRRMELLFPNGSQ
jgi:hypothetical protein